jgi:hypothetical protein
MDHVLSDNPIEYLFIDGLRRWLDVNLAKNNLLKTSLNCRLAKFLITHCSLFTLTLRSEVLKRSNRETVRPPNNGRLLKYLGSESTRHVLIQTEKILSGRLHFGNAKSGRSFLRSPYFPLVFQSWLMLASLPIQLIERSFQILPFTSVQHASRFVFAVSRSATRQDGSYSCHKNEIGRWPLLGGFHCIRPLEEARTIKMNKLLIVSLRIDHSKGN